MPTITALPPYPTRGETNAIFAAKAEAWVAAFPLLTAEINAAVTAMNLNSTNATSATSLLVSNASKTLTVDAGKSYVPGQTVKIAYTTDPTIWMLGDVISYDVLTGALVVFSQYKQGSGTYAGWTISLSAPAPVTVPAGAKTVWFMAAAPTGWTQVTTYTDHALRVVGAAGGGTGGSVNFTTAMASQAVTGSNSATTLTKGQIPQHVHTYTKYTVGGTGTGSGGSSPQLTSPTANTGDASADGVAGGSHNHTFAGNAINLAVKYLDMIMAIKD